MPGKPGNLPPKERAAYLAKVRRHALALTELLEGTRFNAYDFGSEIDPEKFEETVQRALAPWGEDETGHVVAFWVDEDGTYQMPWDYPDCHLVNHLYGLISWSEEDDLFDRSIMRSSKPIVHAKSRNSRTIYFTCTLFERLERYGASIPFGVLATIANVALDLKDDEMLDEDAARKQVRRYQARVAKTPPKSEETPFNLTDDSDPPF